MNRKRGDYCRVKLEGATEERQGCYSETGGYILTWIVILSVDGGDTIAKVKLLISPFLR